MVRIIGAIVGLIKLILNVKKWITMPYRVVMYIHDHPMLTAVWVFLAVVSGILMYHISV